MNKEDFPDTKTNLSRLVDCANHVEREVIQKNNVSFVELVPHAVSVPRKLGALKGQFKAPQNFFGTESQSRCDLR